MTRNAGGVSPAADAPPSIVRSDALWVCLLALSFALDIAVTWRLWGTAVIDCGREMNQPLRLLNGEMLYSDVRHIYGPLSPYLNASLFWLFGPSLDVLYGAGIVCASLIVALVYRIARRFLEPAASAAATSIVIWCFAANQWSSYILPYTFAAVHGCLFGLVTLELLLAFVASRSHRLLRASIELGSAGVAAGLTTLAKTEMGFVALATGLAAILLAAGHEPRRTLAYGARFLLPAFVLIAATYLVIAMRVGIHTLIDESFLLVFLSPFPPELLHFNRKISGMDDVSGNARRTLVGLLRLALVGGLILASGLAVVRLARSRASGWLSIALPLCVAAVAWRVLPALPPLDRLRWGEGPFRGLPLLFSIALLFLAWQSMRQRAADGHWIPGLIVLFVFAGASLGRIILRVTITTPYTAMLVPAAVVALTWLAVEWLPRALRGPDARRFASRAAIVFLFAYAISTGVRFAKLCLFGDWLAIESSRGTMRSLPEHARAINGAIRYVLAETQPGDAIACLPECTAINFFTDRRNPLREEIVTPGYLDEDGESRAIERLEATHTRLILIENRPTTEFGATVFGRDYCQRLMAWIDERFEPVATFGDATPATALGEYPPFFVRAYRRR